MTIKMEFTEAKMKQLDYERYSNPHPRVQRQMEALWLTSQEVPHKDICKYAGISANTLCQYLRDYQSVGIDSLKPLNCYQPKSDLWEPLNIPFQWFDTVAEEIGLGRTLVKFDEW